jgi:O-antigen/teichoic acid export membrane protein
VGNVVVSWLGARFLSLGEFGVLASGLMIGILLAGVARVVFVEPLILRRSADGRAELDREARSVLGMVVVTAVLTGLVLVVVGLRPGASASVSWAVVALGCVVPLLLLQDAMRWICYARNDVRNALFSTCLWTLGTVVGLAVLFAENRVSAASCLAVWGGAAGVAAVFAVVRTRLTPVWEKPSIWMRRNGGLSVRTTADYVLTQAVGQGGGLLIAAVAGAAAYGVLRVAQLPLAVVPIIITGSVAVLQPAMLVHVAQGGRRAARRLAGTAAAAMATAVLGLYAITEIVGPDLMTRVLGPGWTHARGVIAIVAAGAIGSCVTAAYGPYLRAVDEIDYQVRVKVIVAPVVLVAIAVLSNRYSTTGGAIAQACGALVLAGLAARRSYRRATPRGSAEEVDAP